MITYLLVIAALSVLILLCLYGRSRGYVVTLLIINAVFATGFIYFGSLSHVWPGVFMGVCQMALCHVVWRKLWE